MTARQAVALTCLLTLAAGLAAAQSTDAAAERARLGNERIRVEAERQAREELEQQKRISNAAGEADGARAQSVESTARAGGAEPTRPVPPAAVASTAPESPSAPRRPAAADDRVSRALEQLRELGELKDAGYLTEEEFRRIKQRILDREF
jgi:hypothetical protein